MHLFFNKRFIPLLSSHFLSSINDAFMRTLFLFYATYNLTKGSTAFVAAGVIFYALAFCVGSTFAGQIADKISKKKFLMLFRIIETGALILTLGGVSLDSRWALLAIMGGLGFVGACLRVADYSLMPALVAERDLVKANAWIKSSSLIGLGLSALMVMLIVKFGIPGTYVCGLAVVLSVLSLALTYGLPEQKAMDPETRVVKNPVHVFDFISKTLKYKFDDWAYLIGIAWFWVLMSLVGMMSGEYAQEILKARWSVVAFLSGAIFPLGYILGAVVCVRSSRKRLGSQAMWVGFLISFVLLDFVFAGRALSHIEVNKAITIFKLLTGGIYWHVLLNVLALGFLAALYIIPFYAQLQKHSQAQVMGRLFSFSGLLNAAMMAAAFMVILSMRLFFFSLSDVVIFFAVLNLLVSLYFVRLLPIEQRRRFFKKVLGYLFKVKVCGLENLPKIGERCLIVCNHTSYMDVLLISTFIDRPIVFSINERLLEKTLVKFMTNLVDLRPLDPVSPFAVKTMAGELKQNKTCMIFNGGLLEGGNTRLKIYEGTAMMALKGDAPIVPIRIDGAAYTFGSRVLGKRTWFKAFPRITLTVMPPVKFKYPESMPNREQRMRSSGKLYDVISNMVFESYDKDRTIFQAIADAMKMRGHMFRVLDDTTRKPQTFASVFLKSFVLGALIQKALPKEQRVGVMIPTSAACAYTFYGLQAYGKVPAMINFTAGPKAVVSTCQTVGLKHVVTAHKVVQMAKLENLVTELEKNDVKVLYLEDLKSSLTLSDKLRGMWGALFPRCVYKKTSGGKVSSKDTAVILFTSGSEGLPKAVFLSHYNLLSNCYQVPSRFDVYQNDVFLNCLPLFHSFGLGAGTILPMILGVKTFLYPTPLHYRIIPEIAASIRATIFFATDTFLSAYAKCANPYDFNSLRIVAGGAEKIREETRTVWQEKFGVRLFEGYGATECSPFISVNTFLFQKKNSVGRLLPGIECRVKKVDGITEGGELYVKGPNIMQGYMRHTNPGVLEPPKDGWYDTGDIVEVDEDGFITIKGRCKRFAKIGGEMVSLMAVEQTIAKKWPEALSGAVNLPDERKGEKIVLITNEKAITKDALITLFKDTGMTELGLPAMIVYTENPPLLGTGKFDYLKAKEMAIEACNKKE